MAWLLPRGSAAGRPERRLLRLGQLRLAPAGPPRAWIVPARVETASAEPARSKRERACAWTQLPKFNKFTCMILPNREHAPSCSRARNSSSSAGSGASIASALPVLRMRKFQVRRVQESSGQASAPATPRCWMSLP
jgi:hypothetical protein